MNVLYSGIIYFITAKCHNINILRDLNNNIYLRHSMYFTFLLTLDTFVILGLKGDKWT